MACPYFRPNEPHPPGEVTGRPQPPLGGFYDGSCMSGKGETPLPLERCNLGYARGLACFSADCSADANRFSIGKDDGDTITVQWCIERDHRPLSWGEVNWSRDGDRFQESFDDPVLSSQMAAYVASYLGFRALASNG
jgi:hypothetical protein